MARGPIDEPIRLAMTVPVPVESAFTTFVDLTRWWPREYTWAANVLEDIGIEPGQGGHCFERGPYGFTCHWGRVLAWEPPTRLVFTWRIAPDRVPEPNPAKASEVEVRFQPSGPSSTRLELEHRSLARHGEGGDAYRQGLAAAEGWPSILDRDAATLR
jgi:uncharacterized protein YndB with AHSA1/START domain